MNTLVVYDSRYGNTERIAQAIAGALRAFGQAQAIRVDPAHPVSFQGMDLFIVGSLTQGFRPTLAMQFLLGNISYQSLSELPPGLGCFSQR